jgi:hypothetical protein
MLVGVDGSRLSGGCGKRSWKEGGIEWEGGGYSYLYSPRMLDWVRKVSLSLFAYDSTSNVGRKRKVAACAWYLKSRGSEPMIG